MLNIKYICIEKFSNIYLSYLLYLLYLLHLSYLLYLLYLLYKNTV